MLNSYRAMSWNNQTYSSLFVPAIVYTLYNMHMQDKVHRLRLLATFLPSYWNLPTRNHEPSIHTSYLKLIFLLHN